MRGRREGGRESTPAAFAASTLSAVPKACPAERLDGDDGREHESAARREQRPAQADAILHMLRGREGMQRTNSQKRPE